MSSSPDFLEAMSRFKISEGAIPMGLELILMGKSSDSRYVSHPFMKNAVTAYISVELPDGKIEILEPSLFKDKGSITPATKGFEMKKYMGNKIFICPEHMKISRAIEDGKCQSGKIMVGVIIMKGKGFVSFVPQN